MVLNLIMKLQIRVANNNIRRKREYLKTCNVFADHHLTT